MDEWTEDKPSDVGWYWILLKDDDAKPIPLWHGGFAIAEIWGEESTTDIAYDELVEGALYCPMRVPTMPVISQ